MARRVALGGFAFGVFAVAGFVPATAASHASDASVAATAAKTICVGLVIDPRAVGGTVSDSCATVKPGTSGVGVLEAAGHSVTFRGDGLLCTIDALPATGCSHVDNTHYWAYYHRGAGRTTWSYSNQGASTYEPSNRSVDGWVYDDGTSLKPENIPSATICDALVTPKITPTPTKSHASSPTASAAPKPAASQTKSASTKSNVHRSRSPRATSSAVAQTTSPPSARSTPTAATASATAPSPAKTGSSSGHGNATGVLIAAGVIAVLAAAAAITARRRRN